MKNKIPCCIIHDLMPSFLEGLTEKETQNLIEEHLKDCESCKSLYESMKEPEINKPEKRQVDYLKKVKSSNKKKLILSIGITCLIFITLICSKLFIIGNKASDGMVSAEATGENTLKISICNTNSAKSYGKIKISSKDKTKEISVREVLVSPFNKNGCVQVEISLDETEQVKLFGKTIWQNGIFIKEQTQKILSGKTPYIGSITNVLNAASSLQWPKKKFTNALHTSAEPYGWELIFEEPLESRDIDRITSSAPLMIALVDNMGELIYTSPDKNGSICTEKITEKEINEHLPSLIEKYNKKTGANISESMKIKDFSASPYLFQLLLNILDY